MTIKNKFEMLLTEQAINDLSKLESDNSLKKRLKSVRKALAYLQFNPRHPSLNTHKYMAIQGPNREEMFEAYAENKTPAAYRIFWYYGPNKNQITVVSITKHP
jgi:bisphosphoglycerate-dependent phosphoglycerate mutase